jgi:predicted CXXCH cytochrome family protein
MRRLVTLLALALAVVTPLRAGDYHNQDHSNCSDCHSAHASAHQNLSTGAAINTPNPAPGIEINPWYPLPNGGGGAYAPGRPDLVKAANVCLSCHSGGAPAMGAPPVVGPISYDAAAGTFDDADPDSSGNAHDLQGLAAEPPGAPLGATALSLTCSSCHDAHGNDNYRNLRLRPASWTGAPLTVAVRQTVSGPGLDASDVYVAQNLVDKSGISAWCNACHGATPDAPCPGSQHHPVEKTIGADPSKSNLIHWASLIPDRVRAGSPADDTLGNADDRVICVSCHKAHGSAEANALVNADMTWTGPVCQQCHFELPALAGARWTTR